MSKSKMWRGLGVISPKCVHVTGFKTRLPSHSLSSSRYAPERTLDRTSPPLVRSSRDSPPFFLPYLSPAIKQQITGEAPAARICHASAVFRRVAGSSTASVFLVSPFVIEISQCLGRLGPDLMWFSLCRDLHLPAVSFSLSGHCFRRHQGFYSRCSLFPVCSTLPPPFYVESCNQIINHLRCL